MDFVEQVKGSVDIVSVIGEHVRLRKAGANRYMGLCPFHQEKKPSFTVHVGLQIYKCFSCGVAGDVFKFLMEKEGISFFEALKSLAERHGIPMPKRSMVADDDTKLRTAIFEMHEAAQAVFRANLNGLSGQIARDYMAKRGLSAETVEKFGLGYAEKSWNALLRHLEQRGYSAAQLEESGLVKKRDEGGFYDYFRNRLTFPIHSEAGKIIGFAGRALAADDNPKYLNSPETKIYTKKQVLYNMHRAKEAIRKEDRSILVEGYMDAIGVTAAGFHGVVASCGTSLTTQQVQALKRHSQRIVVNFDPDAPGANAAERSINLLLDESMQVRIMELDGDLDPDEYCKERGPEAYQARLDVAKGYFYWLADRARAKHNVHTSEGVVAVLQFLLPAVQRVSDRLERMAIANDLAAYIGVDPGLVLDEFRRLAAAKREKKMAAPKIELRVDERMLLNAIFADAELRGEIIEQLTALEAVTRFPSRRIFQTVFSLEAGDQPWGFHEVHARLAEADQNLLAEAVLREDMEVSRDEVTAAIESVRRSDDQFQRAQLKARIKETARAGNLQEALRLTEELNSIERASRERA